MECENSLKVKRILNRNTEIVSHLSRQWVFYIGPFCEIPLEKFYVQITK